MKSVFKTRKRARIALIASVIACCAVFGSAGSASAAGCPNANLRPDGAADMAAAQTATRCLVNRERRKRGLRNLRFNLNLLKSSEWQANDMVTYEYFAHQRSDGPSFTGRITRFGYAKDSGGFALGENIAWSTSDAASPREIVSMWMDSPSHRQNMLRRSFREQAVSAVYVDRPVEGDFDGAGPLVVYVNQFGARY